MLNVKLSPDLESAVEQQARREKKTKAALVRTAVQRYLEDVEDYRDAVAVLKRKGKSFSLAEVKRRHGLEG